MKIGKLPNDILDRLIIEPIKNTSQPRDEILVGPSIGEDCAVLDFGEHLTLVSTDPITATENNIGKLLMSVCANDIAVCGGTPVAIMVTALIPPSATEDDIKTVAEDLRRESERLNIAIVGGHTEITDAVNRIVLSGTVLGKVLKQEYIGTNGARPGHSILMTKYAGVEGTAILASDYEGQLTDEFGEELVMAAKYCAESISVIDEAAIAKAFGVSGMHDITEGGVLGACAEAAEACGYGFYVDIDKIKVLDATRKICEFFKISPYELISSGSLLITAADGEKLAAEMKKKGIQCTVIGRVLDSRESLICRNGEASPLKAPRADAIYSVEASTDAPMTIMFVCTGNTCRSPMAEGLARKIAKDNKRNFKFISRGIHVAAGDSVSKNAILAARDLGADISKIVPKPLLKKDTLAADIILTMTSSHKNAVLKLDSSLSNKVFTLSEFAYGNGGDNVSDPYGLDLPDYKNTANEIYELVSLAVRNL